MILPAFVFHKTVSG